MKPEPATSARSSHSEGGSAATSASSRGLRFSTRASCIAAGQEKSPWCDCLGRSREISEPGCCGATLASARVSNSVRWALTSADIDMRRCRVLYPGLGLERPSEGRILRAFSIWSFEHGQRRQTHLPRQGLQGFARQVPSAKAEKSGEETRLI